ncbi:MAG: hypothetical protein EB153_07535 [Nitrosopumilaceae archaeon]|nr:hypothetical protein [Nitrosopumilaceae archaeon]
MIPLIGIVLATITIFSSSTLVPGGTVTFYVNDGDLDTSPRAVDEVSTSGLLEFKLAGTTIAGPSTIIETDPSSGVFVGKITIPTTINGRDVTQGDTLVITYKDESDYSGHSKSSSASLSAKKYTTGFDVYPKNARIGQTFQVRINDPDFNLDSRTVDNISLSKIEFKTTNGIKTTLANAAFDAKTTSLRETGENTNQFVVSVKMPKEIDGKKLKIGSTAQLKFTDTTSPSRTTEKLKTNIKIGLR